MLEGILKNVERISKRINQVSRFNYNGVSGVILLSKEWDSLGVILLSDEREILFYISATGQLMAVNAANQKLVSGLRLKILDLINLMEQKENMLRSIENQIGSQSSNKNSIFAPKLENIG